MRRPSRLFRFFVHLRDPKLLDYVFVPAMQGIAALPHKAELQELQSLNCFKGVGSDNQYLEEAAVVFKAEFHGGGFLPADGVLDSGKPEAQGDVLAVGDDEGLLGITTVFNSASIRGFQGAVVFGLHYRSDLDRL